MHRFKNLALASALVVTSYNVCLAAPTFRGLGFLPGGGDLRSEAYGLSADGTVAVGFSSSPSGIQAFRWTAAGGMQGLGTLAITDPYSDAAAISADGKVIVGESRLGSSMVAFKWTAADGPQSI